MDTRQPTIAELLEALPAGVEDGANCGSADAQLRRLLAGMGSKPMPTGRLARAWSLGTLQAKIAAAYLAWWLRSGFKNAEKKQQGLDETHVAAAIQVLGRMGYLRGAVMKLGQVIAHWPHVVPNSFADVLSRLYMDAPPMHFALLREQVQRELRAAPEDVFDDFEVEAFAAASLGQVHRACRKGTAHRVAVKIQYPNIARTIRADMGNLKAVGFPMRLSGDWENLCAQYEGIEQMLEQEVDYDQEAAIQSAARTTLAALHDVVVPRVWSEHSTRRVLTTDYLEGLHLDAFLARRPSQEQRDRHGAQIVRAMFRMWYSGRTVYADPHPGNFLFLPDGRLGLLDFGCCHRFDDAEFDYVMEIERASKTSDEGVLARALARGCAMHVESMGADRLALMREYCDWLWAPTRTKGVFDFGAPGQFEQGVRLYGQFIKRRWTRSQPVNVWLTKLFFGERAMLTHLGARVDYGRIMREESLLGTSGSAGTAGRESDGPRRL